MKRVKRNNAITAIYCRTSTNMQALGMEAQIEACKAYCSSHKIENYRVFCDNGISGVAKAEKRRGLSDLMAAVHRGEIERIVTYSFSRLFRSVVDLLVTMQEFSKLGIDFVSLAERIETQSAFGKAMLAIVGAMAELERDLCSERIRNGLRNAVRKGVVLGKEFALSPKQVEELRELRTEGASYKELQAIYKLDRITIYRYLTKNRASKERSLEYDKYMNPT
jgi:DNA invertase Pin-like site-specific DNA recombinase